MPTSSIRLIDYLTMALTIRNTAINNYLSTNCTAKLYTMKHNAPAVRSNAYETILAIDKELHTYLNNHNIPHDKTTMYLDRNVNLYELDIRIESTLNLWNSIVENTDRSVLYD